MKKPDTDRANWTPEQHLMRNFHNIQATAGTLRDLQKSKPSPHDVVAAMFRERQHSDIKDLAAFAVWHLVGHKSAAEILADYVEADTYPWYSGDYPKFTHPTLKTTDQ